MLSMIYMKGLGTRKPTYHVKVVHAKHTSEPRGQVILGAGPGLKPPPACEEGMAPAPWREQAGESEHTSSAKAATMHLAEPQLLDCKTSSVLQLLSAGTCGAIQLKKNQAAIQQPSVLFEANMQLTVFFLSASPPCFIFSTSMPVSLCVGSSQGSFWVCNIHPSILKPCFCMFH